MKKSQKKIKYLSKNRSYESLIPRGIVIHETATPGATAENSFDYFNSGYRDASAHGFVDWNEYIQMIPYTEVAWHAGYTANHMYIGIELCHPETKNEVQFNAVWRNAVEVVSDILQSFSISYDDIVTHHSVSLKWRETDHTDPTGYFSEYGKTFQDFINDVKKQMEGGLTMTQYEELKNNIESIQKELKALKSPIYNSIDTMPEWAKPTIKKLVDENVLVGTGDGLNLSEDLMRTLVIVDRMM